jgi:hypothetical protein
MRLDSRAVGFGFGATALLFLLSGFLLEFTDVTVTLAGILSGLVGGLLAGYYASDGILSGALDGVVASVFGAVVALPILAFLGLLVGEAFGTQSSFLFVGVEGIDGASAFAVVLLTLFVVVSVAGLVGGAVGGLVSERRVARRGDAAA